MAKRENKTFSVKDLIPHMLQENKLQKGMDQIAIKETWHDVMGNGVTSYTEAVYLKRSTLYIQLNSSTLREELSYGKDKIIDMLNDKLDHIVIKSIKFI